MLDHLTLEQKIGQLLMCGFFGTEPSHEVVDLIKNFFIGGICYFGRNLENPEQIHELSVMLQDHVPHGIPLLISIDQEGGMVHRIHKGVTLSPGNMAVGATGNPTYAYELARIVSEELRIMGINMNFAPCIDVNNNPHNPVIGVRSYGEDPKMVAEFGRQAIRGYQDGGVAASAKHFPGHGDTEMDSHLGMPVVHHPISRLERVELFPFRKAIEENVDSLMVSHVCFPAIEDGVPATLSKNMINGVLRNQYKYEGVVITDCMEMRAIEHHYNVEEAVIKAIQAGADILLFSHSYEKQKRALQALKQAVQNGEISEKRIDISVERILSLKRRRIKCIHPDFEKKELAKKPGLNLAQRIRDESITIVKDDDHLIPVDPGKKTTIIWPEIVVTSDIDEGYDQKETLGDFLKHHVSELTEIKIKDTPRRVILESVLNAEQVMICTYNAAKDPAQKDLVEEMMKKTDGKAMICALRNPYDMTLFPQIRTYVTTYEATSGSIQSLARVLTGEIQAGGHLPVSLHTKS
ncbi:beta-N-acetylhexosaminidase [Melghiribacillus thermohalophilus]|uniref:Beta-N-acetylhexosaminidase n=1 Tax=Melghiribacillus thermohalophilus TaxID=1324956 RepID=A0A4V2V2F9_9BACI|nr:beta-N-acetylhexosaminidase [Melghiribacillus thermohalophilus]TCT24572.1 beta-N-acetylhexosaminidase [Melghiribacillus thermohalophilus]